VTLEIQLTITSELADRLGRQTVENHLRFVAGAELHRVGGPSVSDAAAAAGVSRERSETTADEEMR